MTANGPLLYFIAAMTLVGLIWALKELTNEARHRRRRRKSYYRVVNTAKRPTVTFLVRAR